MRSRFSRRWSGSLFLFLALHSAIGSAIAQMTMPTTGTLPTGTIDRSFIIGDDLSQLQANWLTPVNVVQSGWKSSINGRANSGSIGIVPTTFAQASSEAAIAEAAGFRFAMTGSSADLSKTINILLNAAIPEAPVASNSFIIRPEVLTGYLSAYDYIRSASSADLSPATRATIESNLVQLTQSLSNGNNTYSNARGKTGATRALAGVLLQNQSLLDQGLTDLNGHFAYSTTDDGWFSDAQNQYLNYTMRHLSLFVRAYEQGSGVDLYPNVEPYIRMSAGLRLPEGQTPNVSNGLVLRSTTYLLDQTTNPDAAGLALWGLTSGVPANYDGSSGTNVLNNNGTFTTFFALVDFNDVTPTPPSTSPTFLATGQSKVAVMRNDWSTTSSYLGLMAGIDSPPIDLNPDGFDIIFPAFHTHNDSAEILLASQGKYILVAPGYNRTDLSNSPPGFTPQNSDWHNVVLVDGDVGKIGGLLPSDDLGRTRRPEDFVQTHRLDSSEFGNFKGVNDFSTLRTNYNNTEVSRSISFPHEDYFVVADRMLSSSSHDFGFNLVGRGTQTVLTNDPDHITVQWEFDGAQVIEHLFGSSAMSLSTSQIWMHTEFNQFEQTRRMTATMTGEDGLFLSVLETGSAGSASSLSITKLSTSPDALAILVEHATAGWSDTILTQLGHLLRSVGDLTSDAEYSSIRKESGVLASLMMAQGSLLADMGSTVIDADASLTVSLAFEPLLALGTVSDDELVSGTSLRFHGRGVIVGAWLDGLAISYTNSAGIGSVYLAEGGELRVEFSSIPEVRAWVMLSILLGVVLYIRRSPIFTRV